MRRLAILAAAAIVWSSQAAAQVSDPYRNPWTRSGPIETPGDASKHAANEVLRSFARCIVTYHGDAARRYVLLPLGSWVPHKDFLDIGDSRCLGFVSGRLAMGGLAYRGALAEELLRWDFTHLNADALASASPLDWSPFRSGVDGPLAPQTPSEGQRVPNVALAGGMIGALAECVIRRSPVGSRALLNTKTEPAERAAMQVLLPDIAQCTQATGTVRFNRSSLRQAVAVAYYRLAWAASAAGQGEASK